MFLCRVLFLLVLINICVCSICNTNLSKYWTSHYEDLTGNKKIFFVLSASTSSSDINYADVLTLHIKTPIVIKPAFNTTEMYELLALSSSHLEYQNLEYQSAFPGNLLNFGLCGCKLNGTNVEMKVYMFQTLSPLFVREVIVFYTCQLSMNVKQQIEVEKALILLFSEYFAQPIEKIAANITTIISTAEMQDYTFDEFGGKGIKSCENLRDHLMKCKAQNLLENSNFEVFIVFAFLLLMLVTTVAKISCCISEICRNKVENSHDIVF